MPTSCKRGLLAAMLAFLTCPPTIQAACSDSPGTATDLYGDECAEYDGNTWWCGNFDDADFTSTHMCCACGGGDQPEPTAPHTATESSSTSPHTTTESSSTTPHTTTETEARPTTTAACSDSPGTATDLYGDECAEYDGNTKWCGNFDDADFTSTHMCCACGGGDQPEPTTPHTAMESSSTSPHTTTESSTTTPHTTTETEASPTTTAACSDSPGTATDFYGDECAEYDGNTWWCGNFDDADFTSTHMCCACGGGDQPEPSTPHTATESSSTSPHTTTESSTTTPHTTTETEASLTSTAACSDKPGTATDLYGDECAAYEGNAQWCGNYDGSDFTSTHMCCACGGGDQPETTTPHTTTESSTTTPHTSTEASTTTTESSTFTTTPATPAPTPVPTASTTQQPSSALALRGGRRRLRE